MAAVASAADHDGRRTATEIPADSSGLVPTRLTLQRSDAVVERNDERAGNNPFAAGVKSDAFQSRPADDA